MAFLHKGNFSPPPLDTGEPGFQQDSLRSLVESRKSGHIVLGLLAGTDFVEVVGNDGRTYYAICKPARNSAFTGYSLYATNSGATASFSSGFVNGTVPSLGGITLDTLPAPTLNIASLPYFALLRAEWEPAAGGETPAFYPDGIDSIDSVTLVGATSVTATTPPEVDATSGAVTQNGIAYFPIAEWIDDGAGNPIISSRAHGVRQFTVCGDTDFRFLWNGF